MVRNIQRGTTTYGLTPNVSSTSDVVVVHSWRKAAVGADRDRLYELAVDRLNHAFALHDKRSGEARTIPVMRLTPVDEAR